MGRSCCSDYVSISPASLVAAAQEEESVTMTILCVVFIVLFYVSVFVLYLVMYPKLPKEAAGDEESGDPLPAAERFGKDGGEEYCVICLEDLERNDVVRTLVNCKHVFHVGCIDTWCMYRLACPICRAPFRLFNGW